MPVAVAPVDRQRNVVGGEVGTNGGEQLAALVVDRAPATEAVVVLPHLREPFGWDTSATGDVLKERDHVIRTLRPAKRQEQQRVVGHPVPIHPSWHPLKAGMRGTFTRYVGVKVPLMRIARDGRARGARRIVRRDLSLRRCGGPTQARCSSSARWRRPSAAPTPKASACCDPGRSRT